MYIHLLNTRITIQKCIVNFDELHQQTEHWSDFYNCYSNIKLLNSEEYEKQGVIKNKSYYLVTIRKCNKLKNMNTLEYRVKINNEIYNLKDLDEFNNKYIKFKMVNIND